MHHLIIFTRYPHPGQAKTRLIPALGAAGAADLHRQMAEHTMAQVRQFQQTHAITVEVQFTGADRAAIQAWLGNEWVYTHQSEGDLGDRMAQAIQSAVQAGAQSVLVIGTDCPNVDALLLAQAFQSLQTHDLVIGPASDGGYYLIGLNQMIPELFQNMPWSTDRVLSQTIATAQQHHLAIALLPVLTDIDHPSDLPIWEQAKLMGGLAGDQAGVATDKSG
jgi:uncharacterized protein